MPRTSFLRRAGALVAAAVAAATLTAMPAQAANGVLDPANRLGDITLTPSSGALATGGGPTGLTTAVGCPDGFRKSSRVLFIWEDGTQASKWPGIVQAAAAAGNGLDGQPMARTGTSAARWITAGFPASAFQSGLATYVVTCDPGETPDGTYPATTDPVGTAKYFSVDVRIDTEAKTWAVDAAPVEKVDTTTTLTPTAGNDGSVILTAAVVPAATGSVSFVNTATGAQVGAGTLADGSASATVAGLTAGTEYRFKAVYGGDAAHNGSESNEAVVTTVAEPQPPQQTDITVTIPASATGLKFTVTPGAVALSQATLDGTSYVASGTLGAVTVSDSRTTRTPWTLNGRAGAFVNKADATKTFAASALGWTPALVGTGNAGTAGAAVAPGANGGLSTDKALAQATAGVTGDETRVEAGIALKAPSDVAAGEYTATLTLTLI
ncbi:Ig-like domain-containing protein [Cellulomonas sp. C5510]|uniref:Ig-like domain-containing protein n=1 Tax=Cellulomonas sp. C5510 TaxID=2871170 RepID=UPI001C94EA60|nr:Ig-like domain-containing protein [Cellulomonas sp. C5510]QZN86848.1 Ig-like domain-containing protein [Cellulomonas sp. C5510]